MTLYPATMNLASLLDRHAAERPDQAALIEGRKTRTFGDLSARAAARADGFRSQGLRRGDAVLVGHGMGIRLYEILFALWRCGAAAVFLDPAQTPDQSRTCLDRLGGVRMTGGVKARLWRLKNPAVRGLPWLRQVRGSGGDPVQELPPEAPALITFTSGSTGAPKGVVRTHGFLLDQHRILEHTLHLAPGAAALGTLPVFALANLASGMTVVIAPGVNRGPGRANGAKVRRALLRHPVDQITAAPAFYERLLETGADLPGVRHAFVGGAAVFPSLMRRLAARLPEGEVVAVYGSSEAEPIAELPWTGVTDSDLQTVRNGGGLPAGRPVDSIRVRLMDDEIQVAGPQVLTGYLDGVGDAENKIREGGLVWHRTGDAGRFDDQGRLWLLGRHTARVGELYPFAVEAAAVEASGARLAGLVDLGGRRLLAVEPRKGQTLASGPLDELCDHFDLDGWREMPLPVDTRHQSKVDYQALKRLLR